MWLLKQHCSNKSQNLARRWDATESQMALYLFLWARFDSPISWFADRLVHHWHRIIDLYNHWSLQSLISTNQKTQPIAKLDFPLHSLPNSRNCTKTSMTARRTDWLFFKRKICQKDVAEAIADIACSKVTLSSPRTLETFQGKRLING